MCEFVSWIEYKERLFYLTASDLRTKDGRMLLRPSVRDDISGHGAIREYYPELHNYGKNVECTNFSSPSNFPDEIVETIKAGKFRGIGYDDDLLTVLARNKFKKIRDIAGVGYDKIKTAAWGEYNKKIRDVAPAEVNKLRYTAWAEYDKARGAAQAEYDKTCDAAFWDLFSEKKNRTKAWR